MCTLKGLLLRCFFFSNKTMKVLYNTPTNSTTTSSATKNVVFFSIQKPEIEIRHCNTPSPEVGVVSGTRWPSLPPTRGWPCQHSEELIALRTALAASKAGASTQPAPPPPAIMGAPAAMAFPGSLSPTVCPAVPPTHLNAVGLLPRGGQVCQLLCPVQLLLVALLLCHVAPP